MSARLTCELFSREFQGGRYGPRHTRSQALLPCLDVPATPVRGVTGTALFERHPMVLRSRDWKPESGRVPQGRRSSLRIALAAALLLVFQTLLSVFAIGAGAFAAPLDAYGNPICATGADYSGHGPHSPDHAKLPPCCALGCPMVSGFAGAAPGTVPLQVPRLLLLDGNPAAAVDLVSPAPERRPGNPRAPPSTV